MVISRVARPFLLVVTLSGTLVLAGCNDDGYLPRNSRHWVALSPEIQNKLSETGVSRHSPMLIRSYKKEGELEVWKADHSGEYKLVHTFPVCRWSGQLGPKKREGDRQVPEGFYAVTPQMMNPNSSFYLSFNIGYPNTFDRQLGRDGSLIMVHGACSSRGCFSMTDRQIADIYALARDSFAGGQKAIQMQSFPFRFTPENLARYRADENLPFWKNLKEGSDHFEVTRREVQVAACQGKYRFNVGGEESAPACNAGPVNQAVAAAVRQKGQQDETRVAELVRGGAKALKRIYQDGDQHPSFKNTVYAAVGTSENVSRASTVPQGTSRVAEVSQPDALAFGHVDVPAEAARGLSHQQLIAKAQRARQEEEAQLNPQAPAAGSATAIAQTSPAAPAARGSAPGQSGRSPDAARPKQAVSATALVAETKTPGDQPVFYQRWLGALSGLTASATGTTETPAPTNIPAPPQRR